MLSLPLRLFTRSIINEKTLLVSLATILALSLLCSCGSTGAMLRLVELMKFGKAFSAHFTINNKKGTAFAVPFPLLIQAPNLHIVLPTVGKGIIWYQGCLAFFKPRWLAAI